MMPTIDEPWQIYYEELQAQAEHLTEQRFHQEEAAARAAHEAYTAAIDRLVEEFEYDEAESLALTKAFGRVVSSWIEEGEWDWESLREKLEEKQMEWEHTSL